MVAWGGRAGAKSWAFALFCLVAGTRKPLLIAACRETMTSISDSSHSLLVGWIERIPQLGAFYEIKKTEIVGKNGTRIIFKGLLERGVHNVKSLEGVDICWVDEAHSVSQKSWDILVPTIRKTGSRFLISFNRFLEDDPVWTEFCTGKRGEDKVEVIQINYTDNPWCPQEIIEEAEALKESDLDAYNHIYLGEPYEQASGRLIPTQLVNTAFEREAYLIEGYPKIGGLDLARFGGDESCAIWRQGDVLGGEKQWKGLAGNNLLDAVVDWVVDHSIEVLVVDAAGIGGFFADFAKDSRLDNICAIVEFNGANKVSELRNCANARAESWELAKTAIVETLSLKGTSSILRKQLSVQEYKFTSSQKKILISKQEMRTKGITSPDRADALTMTYKPNLDSFTATLEDIDTIGEYYG